MNEIELQNINTMGNDEKVRPYNRNDEKTRARDEVDGLPDRPFFTCWDFLCSIGAVVMFYGDVITDIVLMCFYFNEKHYVYFGLTATFVIIPALLINFISIKWYWFDAKKSEIPEISTTMWIFRWVFHVLLMGPMWRSIESLYFGLKSVKYSKLHRQYYAYMVYIDADTSLLKLLEAFMESAPQFILQLYVLITEAQVFREHVEAGFLYFRNPHRHYPPKSEGFNPKMIGKNDTFILEGSKATVLFQVLSISSALLSLSLSLTIYARNSRFSQTNKKNISILGSIFHFFWHLFTVGARILALALFASIFVLWLPIVLFVRWIIMTVWIMALQARLSESRCLQHCFELIFGLVYLFTYLNIKDEPTRRKYLFYYSFEVIEDAILVSFWAWIVDPANTYFYWSALIAHFGGVLIGLTCLFVYYVQFHPNGPRNDVGTTCLTALLPPPPPESSTDNPKVLKFQRCKMPTTFV